MVNLVFTSVLNSSYKEEVERQLFFNQNQGKIASDIVRLIQRYGMASVEVTGDHLRIALALAPEPQTLYVLDHARRLAGLMVYLREDTSLSLVIASINEGHDGTGLLRKMIEMLCDIAHRVKGIKTVTLFPGTQREGRLPIVQQPERDIPAEHQRLHSLRARGGQSTIDDGVIQ